MILKRREGILLENFGAQVLLFDSRKNLPYVLNSVAASVLMKIDGEKDHKTIALEICREFDVEYLQAIKDIEGLYDEFVGKELVVKTE